MNSSRRDFVHRMTAGTIGLSGTMTWTTAVADLHAMTVQSGQAFDLTWADRIKGKHKACFDCTETESGYGVWRSGAWARQVMDVMKAPASDLSPVLVLRHNAIVLAMQQSFWDKYKVAAGHKVTHPLTDAPTDKNPALLDEKDGIPDPFNAMSLPKQLARGVITLACNLALRDMAELVKKVDNVSDDEAQTRAVAGLIPGVILQPSGVFGAIRAQQAGCVYVKAS